MLARSLIAAADRVAPQETADDACRKYGHDPVAFCHEVLGFWPWTGQERIMRAALKRKRVSVRSGHKCGKSTALAALALWFYCSYPAARVRIMASVADQVDSIIWLEIKRLVRNARVKIPGILHEKAFSGLYDPNTFGEIKGRGAKDKEAVAGFSGKRLMYLIDEASGVDDGIFQAIFGNRAGGKAWVFLISNPTKTHGEFYESHHRKRAEVLGDDGYEAIAISSRESPNVSGEWREMRQWDPEVEDWVPLEGPIDGLATPEWIESLEREYGEGHAEISIRIDGDFAAAEDAKAFPKALIAESVARHAAGSDRDVAGERLYIGLDPAGEGGQGDDSAMCVRRGNRVIHREVRRGLDDEAHLLWCEAIMRDLRQPVDAELEPIIVVDAAGDIGAKVSSCLKAKAMKSRAFWVVKSRGSDRDPKTMRQPQIYATHRDELAASARQWMRDGGAIPHDDRLETEINAGAFESDVREIKHFTPKKDLREILGRSPDLGDAFFLCCWVPRFARVAKERREVQQAGALPGALEPRAGADAFDPYDALRAFDAPRRM